MDTTICKYPVSYTHLKLCDSAHVILPNLTEAFALLGEDYTLDVSGEKLRDMLKRLCDGGARVAVLTGYEPRADRSGVLKYDSRGGSFFEYTREKIASPFPLHGTGDIFASVCVGAAEKGRELDEALALAVDFTADCIQPVSYTHLVSTSDRCTDIIKACSTVRTITMPLISIRL